MPNLLIVNPSAQLWEKTINNLSFLSRNIKLFLISSDDFKSRIEFETSGFVNSTHFSSTFFAFSKISDNPYSPYQLFLREFYGESVSILDFVYPHIEPLLRHRTGLHWDEHEILKSITAYVAQSIYIINNYNLALVLFATIPHSASDLTLLLLCDLFKVPYLFVEPSLVFPFSYVSTGIPGRNVKPILRKDFLNDTISSSSISHLKSTLKSLNSQSSGKRFIPNYITEFVKFEPFSLASSLLRSLYGVFKSRDDKFLSAGSLHKYRHYPFGTPVSIFKRFVFYFSLYLRVFYRYIYSRFFIDRNKLDLLFSRPFFAYFPNFQIEYSSLPSQGWDFSQLRCIDKIFSHIPDDCNLLVKDHPWTFSFISSSLTLRNPSFYRSLLNYNISFLPSIISPFQIFSHSNCMGIIVNGSTVALEAMVVGIPIYETIPTYLSQYSSIYPLSDLSITRNKEVNSCNSLPEYCQYLIDNCFEFWVGEHFHMFNSFDIDVSSTQMGEFIYRYIASL